MAEEMEKVYCMCPPQHDNSGLLAELINAKTSGSDAATMAALYNQNGMNNPMWLLWALVFGNGFGGYGYNRGGGCGCGDVAALSGRLDAIERQAQNNHNTDLLNQGILGNHNAIHELAGALNMSTAGLSDRISDVRTMLAKVGGDFGIGLERVLNGFLLGNKDITAAIQNCCCENKQLVQQMGYENRLAQKDTLIAMKDQTYTINERLTGIANGLQKGFSDLGYILAQQKGEIMLNDDRNTQKILDKMCDTNTQALRDALAAKDRELLAANIIAGVKKTDCGCCGC